MVRKLTIDFRMHNASGIGTYISNIVPFLLDNFKIVLLGNGKEIEKYSWAKRVDVIECNSKIYSVKEQFELPVKIPICDIFWSPHYNVPLLPIRARKRIVTIHDVYHLAFYDELNVKQKIYARLVINQAVKKSEKVLTVSRFSSGEIRKHVKFLESIDIIYPAVDFDSFKIIDDKARIDFVKKKYMLPDNFLLFVGNVKPHKNLKNLLLALSRMDEYLVIVGKKDGLITIDKSIEKIIENNNLYKKAFFTGYVDADDLPVIYNMAKIFLFLSRYEGFGSPPLEAQACGCPVICSNVASLPEVMGADSAMYCDPYSVEDIKYKTELVLNDENLQNDLRRKGFENVKRFSWKVSASEIIKLLSDVI